MDAARRDSRDELFLPFLDLLLVHFFDFLVLVVGVLAVSEELPDFFRLLINIEIFIWLGLDRDWLCVEDSVSIYVPFFNVF